MYKEPTADQCSENAVIFEDSAKIARAIWYPQMGGYVGKAIVEFYKNDDANSCFEAYVWHDGEFPFSEDRGCNPAHIHHCMTEQFVRFGETVARFMDEIARSNFLNKDET